MQSRALCLRSLLISSTVTDPIWLRGLGSNAGIRRERGRKAVPGRYWQAQPGLSRFGLPSLLGPLPPSVFDDLPAPGLVSASMGAVVNFSVERWR